ncbi:dihydroorotase, homodimeric type, partial [Vibrio parahaemolyticus VPTS-2010_2]
IRANEQIEWKVK